VAKFFAVEASKAEIALAASAEEVNMAESLGVQASEAQIKLITIGLNDASLTFGASVLFWVELCQMTDPAAVALG